MDEQKQDPEPIPALAALRQSVNDAGGPAAVARTAGVNRTHLYNVLAGGPLGRETAAKLRPHLKLAPDIWVELLIPSNPASAGEAAP